MRDDPVTLGFLTGPLEPGAQCRRGYVVTEPMLTHHIPGRAGVLMTPDLVALLEDASAEIVRPLLAPGCAAVGTWIGVHHTGGAGLGETVDVVASVATVDGRRIGFAVAATAGGRRIGHGEIGFTLIRAG